MKFLLTMLFSMGVLQLRAQDFSILKSWSETTIDSIVNAQMAVGKIVGVSIGVIKDGKIVYIKGYGYADKELQTPATANTIYRLASISKTITAVSAIQLRVDNKLNLSMDIRNSSLLGTAWPAKTYNGSSVYITSEDLLTNESGLTNFYYISGSKKNNYIRSHLYGNNPLKATEIFNSQPLSFSPGTQYQYSTQGFDVMAAVIEKAGGASYESQVLYNIADVAHMPFLYPAYGSKMVNPYVATYYKVINASTTERVNPSNAEHMDAAWFLGGGGWMGSARDMASFMYSLMNNELLPYGYTNAMTTDHMTSDNYYYGYGCVVEPAGTDYEVKHTGGLKGTSTIYRYLKNKKDGCVVLTNSEPINNATNWLSHFIKDEIATLKVKSGAAAYTNPVSASLSAPILNFPANNSTSQKRSVFLDWSPCNYASSYVFEISTNSNFTSAERDTVFGDSVYVNELLANTTYYWRVKAMNPYLYGGRIGNWSSSRQFTTGTATGFDLLPFNEGFENIRGVAYLNGSVIKRGLGYSWELLDSTGIGRARYGTACQFANTGHGALILDNIPTNADATGTNVAKYAILTIDLSDYSASTDLKLSFDLASHNTLKSYANRVWIRGSKSDSWVEFYNWWADQTYGFWSKTDMDLSAALAANSQNPSSTFQIRIGVKGAGFTDAMFKGNGLSIDNIKITGRKTITWTGSSSSAWNNASNWSSDHLPDKRHNIIIPANSTVSNKLSLGVAAEVNDLTVNSGGDFYIMGADANQNGALAIYGTITNNGAIYPYDGGKMILKGSQQQTLTSTYNHLIQKLTVENENGVKLGGNVRVKDLTMTKGHLDIGNYDFTITGSTTAGSADAYIRVSGTGKVKVTVDTDPVILPIGRNPYLPIIIDDGGGEEYSVGVSNDVYANPETSTTLQQSDVVTETWTIQSSGAQNGVSVTLQWNESDETISSFDRNNAFLCYWEDGVSNEWRTGSAMSASGSDPYSLTRTINFSTNLYYLGIGSSGSALPVDLTYFSAKWHSIGESAILEWQTALEENNSHFEIERSFDGENWKLIGTVQGHGTTLETTDYQFTDKLETRNQKLETVYYRLKQVDFNGKYKYSETRTLNWELETKNSFVVYPNPNNANVLLFSESGNYKLLSTQGVLLKTYNQVKEIDISYLTKGTYLIQDDKGMHQVLIRQ